MPPLARADAPMPLRGCESARSNPPRQREGSLAARHLPVTGIVGWGTTKARRPEGDEGNADPRRERTPPCHCEGARAPAAIPCVNEREASPPASARRLDR